jgi:hypothetical protein
MSTQSSVPNAVGAGGGGGGTVTQGTPNTAANAWPVKVTDGTNITAVKAASTAAVATDPAAVVSLSPNSPIPTGSNVIGALTANQTVNEAQINGVTPLMGNGVTGTGSQRVTIASNNTAFPIIASGNAASLSADSGNPVKAGAVFNTTLPAPTSGDRVDLQANKFGELVVRHRNKFSNLTGAATTTVKSGTGVLAGISLNNGTASSTITIYDNTAGSGTIIMKLSPGSVSQFGSVYMGIDAEFSTGLTVVTTVASTDVTLFYQ